MMSALLDHHRPYRSLIRIFAVWKAFLFAIALGSGVGPAYDTSSTLLSTDRLTSHESTFDLASKLTRWDAIYFIQSSRRGYLFEQEWAFAKGLPIVISMLAKGAAAFGVEENDALEPLIGVLVATVCHLLSALVLYEVGLVVSKHSRFSFVASVLHILSPAGLFLSAPYSESPFALLSFAGYLLFAQAALGKGRTLTHEMKLLVSGLLFGLSLSFRSNGILNGILFMAYLLREMRSPLTVNSIRRRLALIGGGSAIAVGFIIPQIVAYRTYCYGTPESELRPWCTGYLPNIYSFVQRQYWNVGFLRYWTPSNIPLFLLAAPMLYLMIKSSLDTFFQGPNLEDPSATSKLSGDSIWFIRAAAVPQLVLALLAITNYHIQIITRISSGYPLWYFWLAALLSRQATAGYGQGIVLFMIMYAGIQGALFASFLPPA
ncbi:glycosyltransferase family 76 protein [Xylariaceae sp. FL0255]|nr:glycosyltransferase family 76 protein [Xylariaceae sp. FL0255]